MAWQASTLSTYSPYLGAKVKSLALARDATLLIFLLLSLEFPTREARAQQPGPSRTEVQAVYLCDFAKFIRWPPRTEADPLTICVAAPRPYIETLTRIVTGEKIGSRALAVRVVQAPGDAAGCAILFIDASSEGRLDKLLAATSGKPVLTVSDASGFIDRGGMIQFMVVRNRIRFSVNLRPVESSGISLSSELLKVAVSVNPRGAGSPAGAGYVFSCSVALQKHFPNGKRSR